MDPQLLRRLGRTLPICAAALVTSWLTAQAADFGGSCCADLEERVAELEATTVRKGNRKVSLTLSGHVNEAVLFWDDGFEDNVYVTTNYENRTRFRFKGSSTINADWSAGFYIEIGLSRTNDSSTINQFEPNKSNDMDVRHQALYLKSKVLGTVWLGHTNDSTRDLYKLCVSCVVNDNAKGFEIWGGFLVQLGNGIYLNKSFRYVGAGVPFGDGSRHNVLRWVSPTWHGFELSADWGEDDTWNAALRYKGELRTIQIVGGIGYGENTEAVSRPIERIIGAISLGHKPSGIYAAFSAGEAKNNNVSAGLDNTADFWWATVGIGRKWHSLGKTTFYGKYGNYGAGDVGEADLFNAQSRDTAISAITIRDTEYDVWSLGMNQKIDAAAMDLYMTYYSISGDIITSQGTLSPDTFHAVMTGARIKF